MIKLRPITLFILTLTLTSPITAQNLADKDADDKARDIVSRMTLKQKVWEMHGHGLVRFALSGLFTNKLKPVLAGGNKKLGIPPTIFFDGPRGIFRNKGSTAFPVTMARGASWDP